MTGTTSSCGALAGKQHKLVEIDVLGHTIRFEQFGGPMSAIEVTVRNDSTGGSTTRLMMKYEVEQLHELFKCWELHK